MGKTGLNDSKFFVFSLDGKSFDIFSAEELWKGEQGKQMIGSVSVISILITPGLASAQGWGRGSCRGYDGYSPWASGYGNCGPGYGMRGAMDYLPGTGLRDVRW
jgi:hypothetical protein